MEYLASRPVREPHINVDLQHADHINQITTNDEAFNDKKNKLAKVLTNRQLKVNFSKTDA